MKTTQDSSFPSGRSTCLSHPSHLPQIVAACELLYAKVYSQITSCRANSSPGMIRSTLLRHLSRIDRMNPLAVVLIGVAVVVGGILALRLHPFLSLIAGAFVVAALSPTNQSIGKRVAEGFGNEAAEIGILIAMAAILGKTLMDSGAAERIVLSLQRALGEGQVALALAISGFVLASLVLSDTTFYLLIPLARVSSARSGRNYLLYILAIVAGAVMTHSLVPPAAGPAMVAGRLNVKLTTMMLGGVIVGAFALTSGFIYALWANRRWVIPLRNSAGVSTAELEAIAKRDEQALPRSGWPSRRSFCRWR